MVQTYYSNGKLLITSEYAVLDGAKALAVPTTFGQNLKVEQINMNKLLWTSLDYKGDVWFEISFYFEQIIFPFVYEHTQENLLENDISKRILQILHEIRKLNKSVFSNFIETSKGLHFTTKLDFPNNWGLGSSSTLIHNIAQWAKVDAYNLLKQTFGGSGYDIACAQNSTPITFQLDSGNPLVKAVNFKPEFSDLLYFVHLNKKQDSREAIGLYRSLNQDAIKSIINKLNVITTSIIDCTNFESFCALIEEHETLISSLINKQPIKNELFVDFDGTIKSLGAWGGDFILVASKSNPSNYFEDKGFTTILKYDDMIL